ncbi:ComF family protein [Aquihabitans daechungensis]|uniref:ComF family protein n=1 Tax=Aquihabitans daechungensis TaxID=1052257 RepID=UPI003B9F4BA4
MLLATRCPACSTVGPAPCPACIAAMAPSVAVPVPPGLDACRALLDYDGPARQVVAQLKYRNARAAASWLATGVAGLVRVGEVDLVTWAPTTDLRRRSRGFDHAEVLARKVAAELGRPCWSVLVREAGPPQTGRTLLERRDGPEFGARRTVKGASVLLVDDVVTTGATLAAAARALRTVGAARVIGVAAAHPR